MNIERVIWNSKTRSFILKALEKLKVKRHRVICLCWGGNAYGCNPKAITDCILEKEQSGEINEKFDIYYAFNDPANFINDITQGIKAIQLGSLEYFYILATSQIVISNTRLSSLLWPFKKKTGQYYIQTMHGGHGMKRQELEVKDSLAPEYIQSVYDDASRIDLMISDSTYWTNLARTIFAYPKGEILEVGLPRNDVFFLSEEKKEIIRSRVFNELHLDEAYLHEIKTLVYCPTFRNNGRKDVYGFDTDKLIGALEKRFSGKWYVLVSSHPNMRSYYKEIYDFSHPRMIDVGEYPDLQSLLVISDAAITDYSSAGFEFALNNKPVFILARDVKEYDRGLYFDMHSLPFPFAENSDQLSSNIIAFDDKAYLEDLERFNQEIIGLKETGNASQYVVEWICSRV